MLEAEWDETTKRVVFRRKQQPSSQNTATSSSTAAVVKKNDEDAGDWRRVDDNNNNNNDDDGENRDFSWRSNNNNRRRSRSRRRSSSSSKGIEPASFHNSSSQPPHENNNNNKPGQQIVQRLREVSQQRVIQQETAEQRKQQEWKRQAFKSVTIYKTYPLQERAVRHWTQLRRSEWWGVVTTTEDAIVMENNENYDAAATTTRQSSSSSSLVCSGGATMTSAYSSSSASSSGVSSLDVPEPKRCLRDRAQSPAQSRWMQQYRNEFLQQRDIQQPSSPSSCNLQTADNFGPAIWSMEPRLFGVEQAVTGKRRYVVAHAGRFLDQYWRKTEAVNRHAYELIRPVTPCRLYLDLESQLLSENPALHNLEVQEHLLTELYHELATEFANEYGEAWNRDDSSSSSSTNRKYKLQPLQRSQIVDLDSSTSTKFSRHWIVHLFVHTINNDDGDTPIEALFEDAAAVGYFLRQFVGRLAQEQATGQLKSKRPVLHEHLFVQKPNSKKSAVDSTSCLIDLGVYTRNRLFRILGSSKFGKPVTAALRIAETNEFPFPKSFNNDLFYVPATTNDRPISQNDDEIEVAVQKRVSKTDWTIHAEALAQTFVVPLNGAKLDFPILPRRAEESSLETVKVASVLPQRSAVARSGSKALSHGASPYPMIDDFVSNELAHRGGIQGNIRAWSIEYEQPDATKTSATAAKPLLISYQMSRNRWCECVGRAHRSNNIAWHVDIRMKHCYQTCHDPDCRALNFRGTPVPLPDTVVEAFQDALFEVELAGLDLDNVNSGRRSTNAVSEHSPPTFNNARVDEFSSDESFEQALAALNLDEITSGATVSTVTMASQEQRDNDLNANKGQAASTTRVPTKPRCFNYFDDSSDDEDGDDDEEPNTSRAGIETSSHRPLQESNVVPSPDKTIPSQPRKLSQRYAYLDIDLSSSSDEDNDNTEQRVSREKPTGMQNRKEKPTALSVASEPEPSAGALNEDDSTEIAVPPETSMESLLRQLAGSDSDTSSPFLGFRRRQQQHVQNRSHNERSTISSDNHHSTYETAKSKRNGSPPLQHQQRRRGFLFDDDSSDEEDLVQIARRSQLKQQLRR